MKITAFLAALSLIAFSASCDKHSWEETQVLHEGMHGDHHGAEGHGEADADSKHGSESAGHGEEAHADKKKADH